MPAKPAQAPRSTARAGGDLLAFDNRRVLHGRRGYDAHGGKRFIEGIYGDRDDLHSSIRTLRRGATTANGHPDGPPRTTKRTHQETAGLSTLPAVPKGQGLGPPQSWRRAAPCTAIEGAIATLRSPFACRPIVPLVDVCSGCAARAPVTRTRLRIEHRMPIGQVKGTP